MTARAWSTSASPAGAGAPGPDGQPIVPAPLPPIRTVLYRSSADHGRSWTDAKQIEENNAGFGHGRKWGLRADPSSDNLYAVWHGNPNPRAMLPADDRDIYLRVSHDRAGPGRLAWWSTTTRPR
jgi:hypothetical protein